MLKGLLIGLILGFPVGAMGAMTVERTANLGVSAGLLTGLGSSVADCIYASVGAFGLNYISDFLMKYQRVIDWIGALLIVILGLRIFFAGESRQQAFSKKRGNIKLFLSAFVLGITNPAAIVGFLFAFSYLGLFQSSNICSSIFLVSGVFIGTYVWWGILSFGTAALRQRAEAYDEKKMNRIFGTILFVCAGVVLIKAII